MSKTLKERVASTPLFGANATAIELLYEQYLQQPESVPAGWRDYFESMGDAETEIAHSPIREQLLEESQNGRKIGKVVSRSGAKPASGEK